MKNKITWDQGKQTQSRRVQALSIIEDKAESNEALKTNV